MSLPKVEIIVQNGRLGQTVPIDDGTVGLILQGVAASGLALNTPRLLTSLAEAEGIGITEAYDTTNTVKAWKHIFDFFAEAGTGAKLWILIRQQADTMVQMLNADAMATLQTAANGEISVFAVSRSPLGTYTPTVVGMDNDVTAAIAIAHTKAEALATGYKPCRVLLVGHGLVADFANLPNLKTQTANRVAVLVGGSASGFNAVGLVLGRVARIPVQRNVGRVLSGSILSTQAYIGTSKVDEMGDTLIGTIHDKGYITFRQHVRKSGFYLTDDPTCVPASDDFNAFARGRVIDKAIKIIYNVYVDSINDETLIDPLTGRIEPSEIKALQQSVVRALKNNMVANLEISGAKAIVDPLQDTLSTNKLYLDVEIVPVGYKKGIVVRLGFENPINQ
jgi:hypothetical protein